MAKRRELDPRRERGTRWVMKLAGGRHRRLYQISGGRIGGRTPGTGGLPTLLLTTTGRTSGLPRTWPLGYLEDGGNLVVIASAGGVPTHPAWYLNLRDNPAVTVQIGDRRLAMRAETAGPAERARLWPIVTGRYPFFADYQASTEREIPVVVLRPAEGIGRRG